MKKITLLSEDFPPNVGGVAQWALGVAQGLSETGNEVNIVCRQCDNFGDTQDCEIPVLRLQHKHWKQLRSWYWHSAVRRQISEGYIPDIVIGTKWNTTRGLTKLRRRYNFKLVTVVHGTEVTRPMSALKRYWLKHTLNSSCKIVSVSRFTADFLIDELNVPAEKITVIPNGVTPSEFKHHSDHDALKSLLGIEQKKIMLTLSRVIERKGHDMSLRALSIVRQKMPDVHYVIAGPGNPKEFDRLKKIAKECGVEDCVKFVGYVEKEDLARLYGLCDVYVMPSRFDTASGDSEGFGVTYLEANACNKPVIGGASGGVVDAIVDGQTGYLVDPHCPNSIADKILDILSNPQKATLMGQKGYQRILDRFNWHTISNEILESLNSLETFEPIYHRD